MTVSTVSKRGVRLGSVILTALLCTASLFAAQAGETRDKTAKTAKTAKPVAEKSSKDADDASSLETKRTPFGRSKSSSEKKPEVSAPVTTPFMEVEEKGDDIVFKRRTPFGPQSWTKKRSDLTSEEQEMLRAHQSKRAEEKQPGLRW